MQVLAAAPRALRWPRSPPYAAGLSSLRETWFKAAPPSSCFVPSPEPANILLVTADAVLRSFCQNLSLDLEWERGARGGGPGAGGEGRGGPAAPRPPALRGASQARSAPSLAVLIGYIRGLFLPAILGLY